MEIKSNYLKSLLSMGGGALVLNLGRAATVLISTRYIEPEELGIYFIIIAAAGIITSIAGCGTNISLVKYSVEEENKKKKISIITSSVIFFIISLFTVTAFLLLLNWELDLIDIQPAYIMLCISFGVFFYLNYALQGLKRFNAIAIANSANGISKVIISIALIAVMSMELEGLIWSIIVSNVIGICIQINSLYRGERFSDTVIFDVAYLKSIIKFSLPIYFNQIYSNLYDRGYMLLIAAMLDTVAVAYYGIATMIPALINQFRQVYNNVYFPKLCELLKDKDESRASLLLGISITLIFMIIAFGSIVFYLFSEQFMKTIFSQEYIVVALGVFILLANSAISSCAAIMGFSLVALGHNSAPFKINLFITTISFVASYFVIPIYGYMGVIYVAFTSSILGFSINYLYLRYVSFPINIEYATWFASFVFIVMVIMTMLDITTSTPFVIAAFSIISAYSIYKLGIYQMLKGSLKIC